MDNLKPKLLKITVDIALYCVNLFLLMKSFKYVEAMLKSIEMADAELVTLVVMIMASVMLFIFTSAVTDTYLRNHIANLPEKY